MHYRYRENKARFDEEFKDHVVDVSELSDGPRTITRVWWQKPGTGIDSILYLIYNRQLYVSGDLGDAVYAWSDRLTLAFLGGLGKDGEIDYFASKCQASETGRGGKEWFPEKAEAALRDAYEDANCNADDGDGKRISEQELKDAIDCTSNAVEWYEFLQTPEGEKFFGSDAWESADAGMAPSIRTQFHLAGLERAWKQWQAKQEVKE